jgi:hypothetical protein
MARTLTIAAMAHFVSYLVVAAIHPLATQPRKTPAFRANAQSIATWSAASASVGVLIVIVWGVLTYDGGHVTQRLGVDVMVYVAVLCATALWSRSIAATHCHVLSDDPRFVTWLVTVCSAIIAITLLAACVIDFPTRAV